jgi:hypothetical protein
MRKKSGIDDLLRGHPTRPRSVVEVDRCEVEIGDDRRSISITDPSSFASRDECAEHASRHPRSRAPMQSAEFNSVPSRVAKSDRAHARIDFEPTLGGIHSTTQSRRFDDRGTSLIGFRHRILRFDALRAGNTSPSKDPTRTRAIRAANEQRRQGDRRDVASTKEKGALFARPSVIGRTDAWISDPRSRSAPRRHPDRAALPDPRPDCPA